MFLPQRRQSHAPSRPQSKHLQLCLQLRPRRKWYWDGGPGTASVHSPVGGVTATLQGLSRAEGKETAYALCLLGSNAVLCGPPGSGAQASGRARTPPPHSRFTALRLAAYTSGSLVSSCTQRTTELWSSHLPRRREPSPIRNLMSVVYGETQGASGQVQALDKVICNENSEFSNGRTVPNISPGFIKHPWFHSCRESVANGMALAEGGYLLIQKTQETSCCEISEATRPTEKENRKINNKNKTTSAQRELISAFKGYSAAGHPPLPGQDVHRRRSGCFMAEHTFPHAQTYLYRSAEQGRPPQKGSCPQSQSSSRDVGGVRQAGGRPSMEDVKGTVRPGLTTAQEAPEFNVHQAMDPKHRPLARDQHVAGQGFGQVVSRGESPLMTLN
ncbi:hypothetical protein H920_06016 [Fukomys damarensis]|uniref:Uncharacterized protein n=1 Tax=Fukomys damarensis TaxID=885580 RepID=A0A091DQR1_FUKDA|nr:hypothetical protein H920_06016 [Fukomys damarensis]